MLAGELTVIVGGKETVLKKNDSCYIGPNESREIVNRGNEVCTIFVAVAPAREVTRARVMAGLVPAIPECTPRECWMPDKPGHDAGMTEEENVMSEDFLKDPLSLFNVKGKTAIVTGASGAFGALAAKVLAGAGANVVICANNARRAEEGRRRMRGARRQGRHRRQAAELGGELRRPSSNAAVERFGGVDILVVASGQNKVSKIVDQKAEDFLDVMDANVTQSWLMARAAGRQMLKQGKGGKVILMSSARGLLGHPAGYTAYCASKSAIDGITKALGCEWGGDRHHRQCARADGLPLAADRMDVRGQRARQDHVRRAFSPACRRAASASRPISPGRCCSSPRRRRTSTPATSSTPTAATRRASMHGRKPASPSSAPA